MNINILRLGLLLVVGAGAGCFSDKISSPEKPPTGGGTSNPMEDLPGISWTTCTIHVEVSGLKPTASSGGECKTYVTWDPPPNQEWFPTTPADPELWWEIPSDGVFETDFTCGSAFGRFRKVAYRPPEGYTSADGNVESEPLTFPTPEGYRSDSVYFVVVEDPQG
jgi:hypothetical protein